MIGHRAPDAPSPHGQAGNWAVAGLLAMCYTIAYADRQVVSMVVDPIKRSLRLSDTEIGLMQGISFSLFYVAASLPLAWLADRTSRSRVMSGCVASWSLLSMACGLARSFTALFGLRAGIAVAEAGLTPAALATLGRRFDPRRLATATALYMLAPFVGGGLAIGIGGALLRGAERWQMVAPLPLGLEPWRWVFVLVGAPGLLAAGLLLLLRDRVASGARGTVTAGGFGQMLRYVAGEWPLFAGYGAAMGLVTTILSSYITWLPAAIMRAEPADAHRVGLLFGPVYLAAGSAGTLAAGLFVATRRGPDPVRTILRVMLTLNGLLWPFATLGLLVGGLLSKIAMMGVAIFLISGMTSLSSLPTQHLTPPRIRAQALALLAMVAALLGTGLGPILAGVLSDRLRGTAQPLAAALCLIGGVTVPLVEALLLVALRRHHHARLDLRAEPG